MIYSSSVLLNLFETAQEIRAIAVNPQTEAEMDKELTRLAIFHLSAPVKGFIKKSIFASTTNIYMPICKYEPIKAIQPLQQQRLQQPRHQNSSIVQVKTEHQ